MRTPTPADRIRLATWLLTGPLGHLVAGLLDWAQALRRYVWARARRRTPQGP